MNVMRPYLSLLVIITSLVLCAACSSKDEEVIDTTMQELLFENHYQHSQTLFDEGNWDYITLRAELGGLMAMGQEENQRKISKVGMSLTPMEEINTYCKMALEAIHKEKKQLLKAVGAPSALAAFDIENGAPARIDARQLTVDKEDVFRPEKTLKSLASLTVTLVDNVANSHLEASGDNFNYIYLLDVRKLSKENVDRSKTSLKHIDNFLSEAYADDKEGLRELIYTLAPNSYEKHAYSAIDALHYLCVLEARVLKARSLAFHLINIRFTSCGTGFDKISAVVSGPSVVTKGDEIELELMVAAIDSYQNPEVTCSKNASIEVRDGIAYVKLKVDQSTTFRGTISVKNKQGQTITESWEKKVEAK